MKVLRITALQPGVCRMGIDHPEHPVDHPITRFHAEAVAKLKADPRLRVEEVDLQQDPAPAGAPDAAAKQHRGKAAGTG